MITFSNVTKIYRGNKKPALDNVSLQIDRGEFVFIVGSSGSGKSSCLRLMLREEQATAGQVHVLGHDLSKLSTRKVPLFRRSVGMVFQDFRLLQNKNVYENVAFTLQVIGKSRGFIQEAVPDVLETVGLAGKEKRYPHELSGGEQQRVAIARAVVNRPAILLADEPTGNLDPATSLGIMQVLQEINAAGTTIVMATHEATFVDIMQQRVIEIAQGVVVRDEQSGGYGETASIPIEDLRKAGLRASVRAVSPEKPAISVAELFGGAGAGVAAAAIAADNNADTGRADSVLSAGLAAEQAEEKLRNEVAGLAHAETLAPPQNPGSDRFAEEIFAALIEDTAADSDDTAAGKSVTAGDVPVVVHTQSVAQGAGDTRGADPHPITDSQAATHSAATEINEAAAVAGIAELLGLDGGSADDEEVGPVK